jgi:hypothetical protein
MNSTVGRLTVRHVAGQRPLFAGLRRRGDVANRRIADVADHGLGRLNWADLCRSRAMLEGRIGQATCRPRRLKVTAGSRVPAAKASDNAFVAIYTITLWIR